MGQNHEVSLYVMTGGSALNMHEQQVMGRLRGVSDGELESVMGHTDTSYTGRDERGAVSNKVLAGVGAVSALGIGALGYGVGAVRGDGDTSIEQRQDQTAEMQVSSLEECLEVGLDSNLANEVYGSPEGIYPALADQNEDGEKVEISAEEASTRLRTQNCGDKRALAVAAAFLELRDAKQLPSTATFGRLGEILDTYEANDELAHKDLRMVYSALNPEYLVYTDKFSVTKGQATEVRAENRTEDGFDLVAKTVNNTANLSGWEIGFNEDDKELTEEQIALYKKLQGLVLFTDEGTVVVNMLIGEGEIKGKEAKFTTSTAVKQQGKGGTSADERGDNGDDEDSGGGLRGGGGPGCDADKGGDCPGAGPGGPGDEDKKDKPSKPTPPTTVLITAPPTLPPIVITTTTTTAPKATTTTTPTPPTTKGPVPDDPNI